MKVKYEKPELNVVVFELNEAVASCDTKVFTNHNDKESCTTTPLGDMLIGGGATFTTDMDTCTVAVPGYCYFTSQDNGSTVLFGS